MQGIERKVGYLDPQRASSETLAAVRRTVLRDRAAAPPRFLVRVDEFPHYLAWDDPRRYGTDSFRRFHEIMRAAGVPYLIAVPTRISHAPLDPDGRSWRPLDEDEIAMLARLRDDGVTFALHGRDHRTRFASPRSRSELSGLDDARIAALLDEALAELEAYSTVHADVFVPPFNRFDAAQWPVLAKRFTVIGGGPETVLRLGFQRTPQWRGDAVYLPGYAPLYGQAREITSAVTRAIEQRNGLWLPIVMHWGWEADADWVDLERLVDVVGPYAVHWDDFLAAVERSR